MKKNKKMFAILTLVAFMMTLVPALAFAGFDSGTSAVTATNVTFTADKDGKVVAKVTTTVEDDKYMLVSVPANGDAVQVAGTAVQTAADTSGVTFEAVTLVKDTKYAVLTKANAVPVLTGADAATIDSNAKNANAAIAQAEQDALDATVSNNSSTIGTVDANVEIATDIASDDLPELQIVLRQANGAVVNEDAHADVYVWAERSDRVGQVSDAFVMPTQAGVTDLGKGLYSVSVTQKINLDFKFLRAGEYTLKAAIGTNPTEEPTTTQLNQALLGYKADNNKIVIVTGVTQSTEEYYIVADANGKKTGQIKDGEESEDKTGDGILKAISVEADTIAKEKVVLTVYDKNGNVKEGKLVQLSTSADNVELDKTKLYTDIDGIVEFNVAGIREGNYKIYVKVGNEYESVLNVTVGATAAADIKVTKEPTAPLSTDLDVDDYGKYIRLQMTDANGNLVTPVLNVEGAKAATKVNPGSVDAKYVSFVEKPEKSKLTEKDIWLAPAGDGKDYYTIAVKSGKKFDVEGTYTIKAVLDNGKSITISFEVKTFDKAVSLNIEYPVNTVELDGKTDIPEIYFVDANGVIKDAGRRVTVAANGYAVKKLDNTLANLGQITVKNDEKYIGQTITVTAIAERENLVASTTLTVADEAREVKFAATNGVVNANNKIKFNLVDAQGNIVAVGSDATINDVNVVVTNVTNDARISSSVASTSYSDLLTAGEGTVNLTANKECTATVQVVVKATVNNGENNTGLETKYYSGIADFTFGKEIGNQTQVVMSIGSHDLVKNGVVSTIDAAPMIQDSRTFVPFRALAEAFGATVDFEATTNTVTAKLNGTTVVLTIGSSVMTVGDEAKTLDVAPFISGDRTMIPVRAVAEAFGFSVEATSNPDGTTADVVFTK